MNTREKGILKIEIDIEGQEDKVLFEPIDGTVWLSKSELPELFGVSLQMINACTDLIFKNRLFREENVCVYDLYTSGNTIKYDKREFNLEVIIALAFHINSPRATILRKWFIELCLKHNQFNLRLIHISTEQNYSLN